MELLVREPRFSSNLAVSVVGLDTYGNRFKQTARVGNISRHGGLLTGIRCLRAPGDIVAVEHRGRKAEFRVIWIDVDSGHVGICCTDDSYIWRTKLPDSTAVSSEPALSPSGAPPAVFQPDQTNGPRTGVHGSAERVSLSSSTMADPPPVRQPMDRSQRKFPRYRCTGGITAKAKGTPTRLWGRLRVVGLGGCYIETVSPFRPGTKLELLIGACGLEVKLQGEVRYSHSCEGMGVMFTDLSEPKRGELAHLVAAASGLQSLRVRERYVP